MSSETSKSDARERLLDVAEPIFARWGFEATALVDVAEAAAADGIEMHDHYDDKAALYAAVLERGTAPVFRVIAETIGQGQEPAQAVAGIIRAAMQALGDRPEVALLIEREALDGGGRLTPLLTQIIAPAIAAGGKMASHDLDVGGWDDEDIPHIVLTMAQAVLGYFTMAAQVQELSGLNLLTDEGRERHTRFLIELTARIFPVPGRAR